MLPSRFAFRFAPSYAPAARRFGIRPQTAWAEVDDRELEVRFGPWRVITPRSNITGVEVTGPYARWKTAGPARLAVSDRGLTFATNGERGALITFARPVTGIDWFGVIRHPELTITVDDPDGFAARIA